LTTTSKYDIIRIMKKIPKNKFKEEKMEGFLRRLGVYGCDEIEDFILAGLVTGDPVLFVGPHGTAKTMLCERLAKAMGLKFIAYDASKALFEDVLGFPNPYSLEKGTVDYVATPISLHDKEFVLIDEISRANYQMQNKWLEVIRSRRIMGKELPNLHYVFGAMNPPYYPGAKTLDPALAGRFAFIIWFPQFVDLKDEDKNLVISNLGEDDARLLRRKEQQQIPYEEIGKELKDFIEDIKDSIYHSMEEKLREYIEKFLTIFARIQKEEEAEWIIDGRRAGMIKRGIVGVLSVMKKKGKFSEEELPNYLFSIVPSLVPYSVEREDFDKVDFEIFLGKVLDELTGKVKEIRKILDPLNFLTKVEEGIKSIENIEKKFSTLERLLPFYTDEIPQSAVKRRFFEFHDNAFSPSEIFSILEKEIGRRNEIALSTIEANAIRLSSFMNDKIRRTIETYSHLKEVIMKKYGRKKDEGTKTTL
jgi:MoxR-like ATPase